MEARRHGVTAWVESPFQLLGALEAHAGGLLGDTLAVVPRLGVDPLAVTVAELRRPGLPPGVEILPAAAAPPRRAARLAIGDSFSGQVQRLVAVDPPRRVVLLDDGRATLRMLEALSGRGVPLLRPHVPTTRGRAALAEMARWRLQRLAAAGRLDVVTALDVPDGVRSAAEAAGVRLRAHDFPWVRALPAAPDDDTAAVVVLGTSMVANELIAGAPYLAWVASVVDAVRGRGRVTYRAHRKEDARTLGPLRDAGVDVRTGELPVEVTLRRLAPGQDVLTLPTTAASTLRLLSPRARIHEYAVPDAWWLPAVPPGARSRLVPDVTTGGADAGDPVTVGPCAPMSFPSPLGAS